MLVPFNFYGFSFNKFYILLFNALLPCFAVFNVKFISASNGLVLIVLVKKEAWTERQLLCLQNIVLMHIVTILNSFNRLGIQIAVPTSTPQTL